VLKNRVWLLATFLWLIVIFLFTELPYFNGENTGRIINKTIASVNETVESPTTQSLVNRNLNLVVRKSAHLVAFGILAVLIWKCLSNNRLSYILAWLLTFMYALTDEWHQSFIPGRMATFKDVLIDSLGALIALLVVFLMNTTRNDKDKAY
jgi:VanZ family protein